MLREDNENEIVVGCVARFWEQKNMINTTKAAISVCERTNRFKFIFVGDGFTLSTCKELVTDSNLSSKIEFKGYQKNIRKWLQEFDVFLLYSLWEGLPLSILEAMAEGLPIIASDIIGNRELIDERNGIKVPIGPISILSNAILKFTFKECIERMGAEFETKNS